MIKECKGWLSALDGVFIKGQKYIVSFRKGMYLTENKDGARFLISDEEYKVIFGEY